MRASPFARRRASELGVDLGAVTGTGPDGAITVTDVEAASSRPAAAARAGTVADPRQRGSWTPPWGR